MKKILVLVLFIWPSMLMSQVLVGYVKDHDTDKLMQAVSVRIEQLNIGMSTGLNGEFTFSNIPVGEYSCRLSCIGYKPIIKKIKICKNKTNYVNFRMKPTVQNLNEVSIIAKSDIQRRRETADCLTVIDAAQIRGQAISLESILNKAIGIKVRQTGGLGSSSRMMIHGLEGKRVQIFIDGDPLNSPDGSISIDDIPIDLIERIEVYKGVIPAKFGGDGLGGAVNVVTREFDTDYVDIAYERSSYSTNRATWVLKKNFRKPGILVGSGGFYNKAKNDYFFKSPYHDDLTIKRDHDKFKSYILNLGLTFTKLWFDKIDVELNYYLNEKQIQGVAKNIQHAERKSTLKALELGLEKEDFFIDNLEFDYDFLLESMRVNLIDTSSNNYDFKGNIYSSPNGRGELGWTANDSDDRILEVRQRLNLNYSLNDINSFNWNTSYRYSKKDPSDKLASEHASYNTSGYPSSLVSIISGLTYEYKSDNETFTNMLSAKLYHINSTISESDVFSIQTAPKIKSNKTTNYGYGNAIRYKIIPDLSLKASYQHVLRLPTADELFGNGILIGPAPKLDPETSDNLSLGLMYDSSFILGLNRVQFELSGFYMNINKMIRLMQSSMNYLYVNLDEVEIKGAEAELKVDFSEDLYTYVNATYQDIRDVVEYEPGSKAPNTTKGLRLPNIPYIFGNFGIEYRKKDLFGENQFTKFYWDAQYTHEFFYNWNVSNKQTRIIPSSFVQNIGIQQVFDGNRYSVSAEVHNITNSEVWNMYKLPLMGRSFHLKFRYTFTKRI